MPIVFYTEKDHKKIIKVRKFCAKICEVCDLEFKNYSSYRDHKENFHTRMFHCSQCAKNFVYKRSCQRHERFCKIIVMFKTKKVLRKDKDSNGSL